MDVLKSKQWAASSRKKGAIMIDLQQLIAEAPDNFVIQNALIRCAEVVAEHTKIVCSVSGGGRL